VKEDKSMQGFIDSGDSELLPLKEYRDWLKQIREEPERRSPLRRDGKSAGPGPFNPATRKEMLSKLLAMEAVCGFELISDDDISYIQSEWSKEFDYTGEAITIARKFGRKLSVKKNMTVERPEDNLLDECAAQADFPPELARELLEKVRSSYTDLGRWGAKKQLLEAVSELIKKDVRQAEGADSTNDL
jgi:DNA sulfur modification protein DndC